MELTEEGRTIARATREIIKRKQQEVVKEEVQGSDAKKPRDEGPPARPPCLHEVALPEQPLASRVVLNEAIYGTVENPKYTGPMAKQYPFTLDVFQSTAIACLERRESVLVAAHTSAGKTVVAEYAIAMAFRDKQRVIYTSPLKALSNQKYRELAEEFGDVGLMTGDVTISPNANCIVMTTEILRSMIYRGSEVLREVAWVVFDEVHYMQDRERGVVWEETIINLPDETKMVFLSATLSNAKEFSEWVTHLHRQPCHVVYTEFRPTPLVHYVVPMGGGGMFKVKDDRGFNSKNFEEMRAMLEHNKAAAEAKSSAAGGRGDKGGRGGRAGGRGGGRGGRGGRGGGELGGPAGMSKTLIDVIRHLKEQALQPIIVFSFSRRDCEMYSIAVSNPKEGGLCFTTAEEQEAIEEVFNNAMQCLSEEDREMPNLKNMLTLLKTGIGIHHSGLLPLLKELIELLFQEQLIKVLFTTETFAMGLNMPARTVVFTDLQKFDGTSKRFVTSGEYIQMSGRAGRRGKDTQGTCIIIANEELEQEVCQDITTGKPSPLLSRFKLTYYTLLNLIRRAEGGMQRLEYVIANSFQQFQQEKAAPQMRKELEAITAQAQALQVEGEEALGQYQQLRAALSEQQQRLQQLLVQPDRIMPFLRPGRLVQVGEGQNEWGWGVVVSVMRRPPAFGKGGANNQQQQNKENNAATNGGAADDAATPSSTAAADGTSVRQDNPASYYVVDVLLSCDSASLAKGWPRPPAPGAQPEWQVVPVQLSCICNISTLRLALPDDLRGDAARGSMGRTLLKLLDGHEGQLPALDPIDDMGLSGDTELTSIISTIEQLESQLRDNPVYQSEADHQKFALFTQKAALLERAAQLRAELSNTLLANFKTECKSRITVMQKLGFLSEEGQVTLKGRAACEVDATDELLATELMFNGTFGRLDPHQLVALVSCLVQVEASKEQPQLAGELKAPLADMQAAARHIASVSRQAGLDVEEEDYLGHFQPVLMDVVYHWSKGRSFAEVAAMTDLFEGSVIRATRRLDELMQQLTAAAQVVGETELEARLTESNATIRRDIMFAASLYL